MNHLKSTRIYLDTCSYNRPFDNQNSIQVRLEADAKLYIQELVRKRNLELVWSFVLDYENSMNPYPEKRERIQDWRDLATLKVVYSKQLAEKAKMLMMLGLKQADAAHLACAIIADADYFITTDKQILNKNITKLNVVSPITFISEVPL